MSIGARRVALMGAGVIGGLALVLAVSFLLRLATGVPSTGEVRCAFEQSYPQAHVQDIFVGEGDDEAAYFHVVFVRDGDTAQHEVVWLYLKNAHGAWELAHQERLR